MNDNAEVVMGVINKRFKYRFGYVFSFSGLAKFAGISIREAIEAVNDLERHKFIVFRGALSNEGPSDYLVRYE